MYFGGSGTLFKNFRLLGLLIGSYFLASAAGAQAAPNPELKATLYQAGIGPQAGTLRIGSLDLDIEIAGSTARTVATVHFDNPSWTALEGDFTLDLPANAVVTGYALDIDDKMIDGVLVSHRTAKLAYEARVRRGLDPGMAEVTRSNAFRTHVFPILAGKGRTIRLSFVTPLVAGVPFTLPLETADPVGRFSVDVRGFDQQRPEFIKGPGKGPGNSALQWVETRTGYEARGASTGRALSGALEFVPNAPSRPLTLSRHRDGEIFFEIDDVGSAVAPAPKRVRLYWDSSTSRQNNDLAREAALVRRYLDATRPAMVDLVSFSDEGPRLTTYSGASATTDVLNALKNIEYLGATSIAGVLDAKLPAADACLLFSDGNIDVDSSEAGPLLCTLFAISSAADADRGFLKVLAQRSGGDYFDLAKTDSDPLLLLTSAQPRVTGVSDAAGNPIDYAVLAAEDGHFHILGLAPRSGAVTVQLAGQNGHKDYAVDPARAVDDDAAGALWALHRADELAVTDPAPDEAILALARRYSVVAANTSFVVLETAADYANAGIEMPASFGKERLEEYKQDVARLEADKAAAKAGRLTKVIAEWTEQRNWWQTKFEPAKFDPSSAKRAASEPYGPAPSPTLAPPLAPPPPSGATQEDVLVTGSLIGGANAMAASPVTQMSAAVRPAAESPAAESPPAGEPDVKIAVAPWDPDRPYITALGRTEKDDFWAEFHAQERQYGSLPAFYLDVAELLFRRGQAKDAVRVALSALDLPTADTSTLTVLADRMIQYGDERRALWLLEKVQRLDEDRPQPLRNLALFLIHQGDRSDTPAVRKKDYMRAVELLNEIVTRPWDRSFDGIELIALMEANNVLPKLRQLDVKKVSLDPRLVAAMDVDLRVTLEWNTDFTDMDLWVDEPGGERAIYSHRATSIGGRLSNDMTNGYGPEEYLLTRAPAGTYKVQVNVYRTDRLNPNGATVVRVHLYRAYGRPNEQEQTLELELKPTASQPNENNHLVGTFTVK